MLLIRLSVANETNQVEYINLFSLLFFPIISTYSTLLLQFPTPKIEKNRKTGEENYPPEEADQYFGKSLTYSKVQYNLYAYPVIGHNPVFGLIKATLLNQ